MVSVTKEEADIIREKCPDAYITMTCQNKKSNRKNFYVAEVPAVRKILRQLRRGEQG